MKKVILLRASFFAMALSFSASPVMAQQWVSPNGSDANACTPTAPCATFQRAINIGASQINCLGSGNYGPVTIQTSITIDCGAGNIGNISSSTATAILITTSVAATVILRHLAMNGFSSTNADTGINAAAFFSGTLIVEDCLIHGYSGGTGINFVPTSGRGLLQVSNSQIVANGEGIFVTPNNGQIASVTLNKVEITGNVDTGLLLIGDGVVAGTMRDSLVASNTGDGILTNATQVFFTVEESSIIANLANGIHANSAGSNLNVTTSTISGNGTGIKVTSGSIVSFGNNTLNGNGTNGNFTSTTTLR